MQDIDLERGALKAASAPEFDEKMGLLQTPQAFYNLDTKDLLGAHTHIYAIHHTVLS